MTNQEQPDTRPRCARNGCGKEEGAPVHAYPLNIRALPSTHRFEPPAPDTQSGGRPTVFVEWENIAYATTEEVAAAIRAPLERALQEARSVSEHMEEMYQSALRQANAAESTIAGLREQVEGLRADNDRLRELDGPTLAEHESLVEAFREVDAALEPWLLGKRIDPAALAAAMAKVEWHVPPAATRPVPASPEQACATCDRPRDTRCGVCGLDIHGPSSLGVTGVNPDAHHPFAPAAPGEPPYEAMAEKARAVGRALGPVDDPGTPLPDPFAAPGDGALPPDARTNGGQ